MQVVKNENTISITISKSEIDLFKVISSYLEDTEQIPTIFKELPIEQITSIEKLEPTIITYEEIAPVKKEPTIIDLYAQRELETLKTKAKYNFQRNGIYIIKDKSEIPVLEKGDKGIKDERKIDIKCAIAKVLGYYVKGKQVFSPHNKPLTNKITYKFKKDEPNAGEQLQLDPNEFREYLIKLQFYNQFKVDLMNENALSDTSDTPSEKEALKPHYTAKEVVKHLEEQKPKVAHPYQIDSKAKKIKVGNSSIVACVDFYDMDRETQDKYIQWWYSVGQKLLTTEIADITI